jgi:4-amino-4-deoxy-L-arabinose transferase-like glycosyltransferase
VRPPANFPRALMLVLAVAATVYFFQLGSAGFDDAETYSAFIASRLTIRQVFEASLQLDPGKGGGLYVFMLHWYCGLFGAGEAALRAFSATFALASVILVYALAFDLFGAEIALSATILWAFNPIALIVARWARMYSMFIALTLASLLAMRKVERHPNSLRVATFAVLAAAMLYTHLGAALMLAAEAALLVRDRVRGRAIAPGCIGMAIAVVLFAPIAPSALGQLHASALGHRFDWIGSAHQMPIAIKVAVALTAALLGLALMFAPPIPLDHAQANQRDDDAEPMRWCAIWTMLPLLALMSGSLLFHPMFEIRYIAPVVAGLAILAAAALNLAGARMRNLAGVAIASSFLVSAIFFQVFHAPFDLWPRIARRLEASASPTQEVFFEAGYVMGISQAAGLDPDSLIEVLPNGYLRIPVDYYFRGTNQRRAINPFRTDAAREAIARSARRAGGAWLVSHMNDNDLVAELPSRDAFDDERVIYDPSVSTSLYHIVPHAQASPNQTVPNRRASIPK